MSTPTVTEDQNFVKLEETSGLALPSKSIEKTAKKTDQYCAKDKHPKEPMVRMGLQLFRRRKTMLIAHYSDRLNPASLQQIAEEFNCTVKALLNDLAKRDNWEPFIWEVRQAHEDGLKQLNQLQLAREEALYLMKTCKAPNARVGAIARFIDSIKAEIELGQSLGVYPKARLEPQVKVDVNVSNENEITINETNELLKRYEFLFKEAAPAGTVSQNGSVE